MITMAGRVMISGRNQILAPSYPGHSFLAYRASWLKRTRSQADTATTQKAHVAFTAALGTTRRQMFSLSALEGRHSAPPCGAMLTPSVPSSLKRTRRLVERQRGRAAAFGSPTISIYRLSVGRIASRRRGSTWTGSSEILDQRHLLLEDWPS